MNYMIHKQLRAWRQPPRCDDTAFKSITSRSLNATFGLFKSGHVSNTISTRFFGFVNRQNITLNASISTLVRRAYAYLWYLESMHGFSIIGYFFLYKAMAVSNMQSPRSYTWEFLNNSHNKKNEDNGQSWDGIFVAHISVTTASLELNKGFAK